MDPLSFNVIKNIGTTRKNQLPKEKMCLINLNSFYEFASAVPRPIKNIYSRNKFSSKAALTKHATYNLPKSRIRHFRNAFVENVLVNIFYDALKKNPYEFPGQYLAEIWC